MHSRPTVVASGSLRHDATRSRSAARTALAPCGPRADAFAGRHSQAAGLPALGRPISGRLRSVTGQIARVTETTPKPRPRSHRTKADSYQHQARATPGTRPRCLLTESAA